MTPSHYNVSSRGIDHRRIQKSKTVTDINFLPQALTNNSMMSSMDDNQKMAEEFKEVANRLFAEKLYDEAIMEYTRALALSKVASYYANRAFAYIKLELYGAALADSDDAINLDPNYIKAYYRRACSLIALDRLPDAIKNLRIVVKLTNDPDAKQKLSECEKEFKRIQFAKAIAVEETNISIVSKLGDVDSIIVEPSYKGPSFDDKITLEFVLALLDSFKAQSKLHKKYAYKLLLSVKEIFESQPSLVDVDIPQNAKLVYCFLNSLDNLW